MNGLPQHPIEGVSLLYSLTDSAAPSRRTTRYFEMFGNRAIYHDGWFAGTIHSEPWAMQPRTPLAEDVWELHNVREDFSLSRDRAAENPAKLKELQDVFLSEARKYNVLPIDDRKVERFNPAVAGRPDLMGNRTTLTVGEGMTGMMENAFINVKNRSHAVSADVELPASGQGVIIAQGGRFGSWSPYMKGGRVFFLHNLVGRFRYSVASPQRIPAGRATIRYEFTFDGGGPGKGGTGAIFGNDKKVGEGRIDRTTANAFAAQGAGVSMDFGTPVSENYRAHRSRFNGRIHRVTIELK